MADGRLFRQEKFWQLYVNKNSTEQCNTMYVF
jgi:hypothetical protein